MATVTNSLKFYYYTVKFSFHLSVTWQIWRKRSGCASYFVEADNLILTIYTVENRRAMNLIYFLIRGYFYMVLIQCFLLRKKSVYVIVACRLKAGISKSERASIARQRPGSHPSCPMEVKFSRQRPHKCLFSQQRKERLHDNGGINCSIRWSLVGKPSSYERYQNRVSRHSDPRKTALARDSSIYKRQIRPLVREGAPQKQGRKCQTVINIWSWAPDGARHQDLLTDW
jgi:hypothetical protein